VGISLRSNVSNFASAPSVRRPRSAPTQPRSNLTLHGKLEPIGCFDEEGAERGANFKGGDEGPGVAERVGFEPTNTR
jgi:hypothetical protein